MVIPKGRPTVPDTISDTELAARPQLRQYATQRFVYGNGKYCREDDMVGHTVKAAFPIFSAAFLVVKLSLHSTTHPTIALMRLMRFELRT